MRYLSHFDRWHDLYLVGNEVWCFVRDLKYWYLIDTVRAARWTGKDWLDL